MTSDTNTGATATTSDKRQRGKRKLQVGKVVSAKMNKTITVEVERLAKHPMYEKFLRRRTRVHAHDEENQAKPGDVVEVVSTRPLSKLKRWRLVRVISKAQV